MISKNWNILEKASQDFISRFSQYNSTILQLLYNRKIDTKDKIDKFYNSSYADLHDPLLFKDMDRALERIEKAMDAGERVGIYGDYDADGVTSSIVLTEIFKKVLSLSGQIYIPDRAREGYGLNKKAIDWLIKKDIKLIVTCDCGVANKEEIDYAISKGVDVIVFDHHHLSEEFSNDYIIVNAKQKSDKYPYKELSGVGIVFKLAQAIFRSEIIEKTKTDYKDNKDLQNEFEKSLLDLVAIGTIADCSPLTGENRILVQEGLKILAKTKRQGFMAIAKSASVDLSNVDSFGVGFYLAPRINSAGRLDHANAAYKLLITESYGIAKLLSYQLELSNRKRQKITEKIFREIKKDLDLSRKVLIAHNEDWPLGVLGIVASKLCEEYFKPTLVLTKGKKESSGSARSIPSFNIIEAINECKDLLLEFGGHSGAAGCSLVNENIEKFSDKINKIADEKLNNEDLIPKIDIEAEINLEDINWELYNELEKLKPFGANNEKPLFKASNVQVMSFDRIGRGKDHLKLMLCNRDGKGQIEGVYFNIKSAKLKELENDIDLVFEIDCNEWGGKKDLQLRVVDFRRAK